ncbi:uncharacterized protein LOC134826256 [Bolinopsis microptera]|uniref:uncharacterized protein LOC134826256 n=1 Tax=Bolinopsis microptera TaxID=2820187 RepID=UPI003078D7F1
MSVNLMMMMMMMLLAGKTRAARGPLFFFFDHGIIGKVSEGFLQNLAGNIAELMSDQIQGKSFSGSNCKGVNACDYDIKVTSLDLRPNINLQHDRSDGLVGQLVVKASIGGSINASGRWSVKKKVWFKTFSLGGHVDVLSTKFSLENRVVLGRKSNGRIGFSRELNACKANKGSLNIKVSGSWLSWLLNIISRIFSGKVEFFLERLACREANKAIDEALQKFEEAVFNKDVSLNLESGGELKLDFHPSVITGGEDCAIIVSPVLIKMIGQPEPSETVTPPFINIPAGANEIEEFQELRRKREFNQDWCDVVPGSKGGVSVIVTEDMISRIIQSLHLFDLMKFSLKESGSSGSNKRFDVFRSGQHLSTFNVELPKELEDLATFTVTDMKIRSTSLPEVQITTSGVSATVNLRARIILSIDSPQVEMRTEFESKADFKGTVKLAKKDGRYLLLPRVTANVDVWTGKLYVESENGQDLKELDDGDPMLYAIELLLNSAIDKSLAKLLEEEVQDGIPINIPSELLSIGNAVIHYQEDYILVNAQNIRINLH